MARWPRRRKSEKLVALIVLEKRQKQPSTFLQTKKKPCFRKTFFSVLVPEGDQKELGFAWLASAFLNRGYKWGYTLLRVGSILPTPFAESRKIELFRLTQPCDLLGSHKVERLQVASMNIWPLSNSPVGKLFCPPLNLPFIPRPG